MTDARQILLTHREAILCRLGAFPLPAARDGVDDEIDQAAANEVHELASRDRAQLLKRLGDIELALERVAEGGSFDERPPVVRAAARAPEGGMSYRDNPLDKRHFHGALANRSPFACRPVVCLGCNDLIQTSCLIWPADSRICHACWLRGVRDPGKTEPHPDAPLRRARHLRLVETVPTSGGLI